MLRGGAAEAAEPVVQTTTIEPVRSPDVARAAIDIDAPGWKPRPLMLWVYVVRGLARIILSLFRLPFA